MKTIANKGFYMKMLYTLKKSFTTFVLISLLGCSIISMYGFYNQNHMKDLSVKSFTAKDIVADILPPPLYLIEYRLTISQAIEGSISFEEAESKTNQLEKDYLDRIEYWKKNESYGLNSHLLGNQHSSAVSFINYSKENILTKLKNKTEISKDDIQKAHQLYLEHRKYVDGTVTLANNLATESSQSLNDYMSSSLTMIAGIFILTLFFILVVSKLIIKSIESTIRRCKIIAEKIANGDLSLHKNNNVERNDIIGELEKSLENMKEQLLNIVSTVKYNSQELADAVSQIAEANRDLSSRTEQQAASVEETSSTMTYINGIVTSNSERTQQAKNIVFEASEITADGSKIVQDVISKMNEINLSSNKIQEIVSVIDGIAFQTNILALNAAVEAARAGRGFAVVAGEVRTLSKRSADAAEEIKELIAISSQKTEDGNILVSKAGEIMNNILLSVNNTNMLFSQISQSMIEQKGTIESITGSVSQIDDSIQQNAAMVEEMSATTDNLNNQAINLVKSISHFKV